MLSFHELVLYANHSEFAGQDKASLASPSNGGSPNPLPANQQQSVPNARAVPPAIAGQASAKPSAATAGLIAKHSLVSMLLICHLWLWSCEVYLICL